MSFHDKPSQSDFLQYQSDEFSHTELNSMNIFPRVMGIAASTRPNFVYRGVLESNRARKQTKVGEVLSFIDRIHKHST